MSGRARFMGSSAEVAVPPLVTSTGRNAEGRGAQDFEASDGSLISSAAAFFKSADAG